MSDIRYRRIVISTEDSKEHTFINLTEHEAMHESMRLVMSRCSFLEAEVARLEETVERLITEASSLSSDNDRLRKILSDK